MANAGGATLSVILSGTTNREDLIREWTVNIGDDYSQSLPVATATGVGASVTVTSADLRAAFTVAVESVQGTPGTDNEWTRSGAASVAESEHGGS
ncbi:MAG: hypothetical protein OXR05_15745 [Gemmatimonadota bacterium]|nr:hypothetical protein [Gemmatimonadota bacterium]